MSPTLRFALFAVLPLLLTASRLLSADPPGAKPDQPAAAKPEPAEAEPEEGEPKKPQSPLDEALLKGLLGTAADEASSDEGPLERAIDGMRAAHEHLGRSETGATTQDLQKRVVKDLDELIELARQQRPQSSSSASRSQKPNPAEEPSPQPPTRKTDDDGQDQSDPGKTSAETSEQNRQAKPDEAELIRRGELLRETWGHLPKALRRQMLNIQDDRFLPAYEDLVRRYFQALAEQGRKKEKR